MTISKHHSTLLASLSVFIITAWHVRANEATVILESNFDSLNVGTAAGQ